MEEFYLLQTIKKKPGSPADRPGEPGFSGQDEALGVAAGLALFPGAA
jgi:hypothetical protein